jgi:DNA-binding NtrC family response regulator
MIRKHEFREDLFYRLNVASLHVPALQERSEDIPVLANHFLKLFATRYSRPIRAFSPEAMQNLKQNPFPGNVRQLENLIEQAVVRTESETITLKDLDTGAASPDAGPSNEERDLLLKSIADNKFNVRRSATELGVSRTTIYRMLHRNGIRAR